MKSRVWLAMSIALAGILTGWSHAQKSENDKWDEAEARQTAIAIAQRWKFSPGDFQTGDAKDLQHNIYAVLPFDIPGTPRRVLLIATAPPNINCHACSPVTGAVIFALKEGNWRAVYDQPNVISTGAFGKPPSARVRHLGPSKPAIEFELTSMAQGYEGTSLTLVAEVNQKLREVLSVVIGESNEAADMPPAQTFKWDSKLETSRSINEGFPDIVMKSSGTKRADSGQEVRPYSATATYQFNGEVYKKVQ